MTSYTAFAGKDGKFWLITVARTDGSVFGMTQARSVPEIEYMARDLIAIMLEVPADSFDLEISYPAEIAEVARKVEATRAAAREAATISEETTRRAALYLTRRGVSVRDAAELLHISSSRVGQLTKDAAA
jgi:hypothetical protein